MAYFSILIPVFNRFGKMDPCVSSLMEQTFGDFEAILVNDGSTDESLAMHRRIPVFALYRTNAINPLWQPDSRG